MLIFELLKCTPWSPHDISKYPLANSISSLDVYAVRLLIFCELLLADS